MTHVARVFRSCVTRSLLIFSLLSVPFSLFAATPLDINSATASELAAVMSGVGTMKAEAIVSYREMNGPFESLSQLTQVKGIGEVLVTRNQALLRVVAPGEVVMSASK